MDQVLEAHKIQLLLLKNTVLQELDQRYNGYINQLLAQKGEIATMIHLLFVQRFNDLEKGVDAVLPQSAADDKSVKSISHHSVCRFFLLCVGHRILGSTSAPIWSSYPFGNSAF